MKILLLFLSALLSQICVAEGPLVPGKTKQAPLENIYPRFSYHGYGTINYQYYDWDTDNTKRASIDLERVSIEPSYQFSEFLRLDAEIEFEHGGTGSTMEFDKVEEFGEFESEIEKGGEIKIEEFAVSLQFHSAFNLRLGHFFVPIGWVGKWDEPTDYSTVIRSEAERALLPVLWDESGIEIYGEAKNIQYQFQIINGLDATGFSSGNWIAGGHQGRFETVNAENLADGNVGAADNNISLG